VRSENRDRIAGSVAVIGANENTPLFNSVAVRSAERRALFDGAPCSEWRAIAL